MKQEDLVENLKLGNFMRNKFGNSGRDAQIEKINNKACLDKKEDVITTRCKFNFHYFDKNNKGQDFKDWDHSQLASLLEKLKHYSESSLSNWISQKVLVEYGYFPEEEITDFTEPSTVPAQAKWARFRLSGKVRLVGFTIPKEYDDKINSNTEKRWDINTFYIVFLDKDHKFWKTEKDKC